MRVYIAAPYAARDHLRPLRDQLVEQGDVCTSTWLGATREVTPGTLGTSPDSSLDSVLKHALMDLADVASSHALVQVTAGYCHHHWDLDPEYHNLFSGGRSVEMGYALAQPMPVILLGPPENIFQRALATQVNTWEEVLLLLANQRYLANPTPR